MNAVAGHGASVRVEACGKTFADGTRALELATLDIARGETLVLLGPSGCGKTTMLRIIAGLELPDAGGRVLFDGKDMTSVPIERRNVGMVFQSYALFPNMSVADNIGYGLKIRSARRARARSSVATSIEVTARHQLPRPARQSRRPQWCGRARFARRAADRARRLASPTAAAHASHDLRHPGRRGDGARRPHRGDAAHRAGRHASGSILRRAAFAEFVGAASTSRPTASPARALPAACRLRTGPRPARCWR